MDPRAGLLPEALHSFPCSESAEHLITATVATSALLSKVTFMGGDQPAQHHGPKCLAGAGGHLEGSVGPPGWGRGEDAVTPSEHQRGSLALLPEPPP